MRALQKRSHAPPPLIVGQMPQSERDVLTKRVVREKPIVLKKHPYAPLPRGKLQTLLTIEQHPIVQYDAPAVGMLKPRNASQQHALARTRWSKNAERRIPGCK